MKQRVDLETQCLTVTTINLKGYNAKITGFILKCLPAVKKCVQNHPG